MEIYATSAIRNREIKANIDATKLSYIAAVGQADARSTSHCNMPALFWNTIAKPAMCELICDGAERP